MSYWEVRYYGNIENNTGTEYMLNWEVGNYQQYWVPMCRIQSFDIIQKSIFLISMSNFDTSHQNYRIWLSKYGISVCRIDHIKKKTYGFDISRQMDKKNMEISRKIKLRYAAHTLQNVVLKISILGTSHWKYGLVIHTIHVYPSFGWKMNLLFLSPVALLAGSVEGGGWGGRAGGGQNCSAVFCRFNVLALAQSSLISEKMAAAAVFPDFMLVRALYARSIGFFLSQL